jgi:hypothetical protein
VAPAVESLPFPAPRAAQAEWAALPDEKAKVAALQKAGVKAGLIKEQE